jgi:toxin ParE1/3/4
MKKFDVRFRPLAEADLFALYDYIAEQAGHTIAGSYIDRLEAACLALENFPERGMRRDDIRPGIRTIRFERRATIVFRVLEREVVIIRIFYGVRTTSDDCGTRLRSEAVSCGWRDPTPLGDKFPFNSAAWG